MVKDWCVLLCCIFLCVGVEGAVETITTYTVDSSNAVHVVVSSNSTGDVTHGANKCTTFQLTSAVLSGQYIIPPPVNQVVGIACESTMCYIENIFKPTL